MPTPGRGTDLLVQPAVMTKTCSVRVPTSIVITSEVLRRDRRLRRPTSSHGSRCRSSPICLPSAACFMRVHTLVAPRLTALFEAWAAADLMHLFADLRGHVRRALRSGDGSPSAGAHGIKQSKDVGDLSNHAFGRASRRPCHLEHGAGNPQPRRARKAASSSSSRSPTASAGSGRPLLDRGRHAFEFADF